VVQRGSARLVALHNGVGSPMGAWAEIYRRPLPAARTLPADLIQQPIVRAVSDNRQVSRMLA
jgi:hypothetical protein